MCGPPGENCRSSAGNNGSPHTRRPSRCVLGCPVPTDVHTATGITSMVVAQAGVPVHLSVHTWATQVSMTQLFAQVIPGLGSLSGSGLATITGGTQMSQPVAAPKEISTHHISRKAGQE